MSNRIPDTPIRLPNTAVTSTAGTAAKQSSEQPAGNEAASNQTNEQQGLDKDFALKQSSAPVAPAALNVAAAADQPATLSPTRLQARIVSSVLKIGQSG